MDKAAQRPGLGLIAFIVFIDMAGIGLIIPVMPKLVMQLSGAQVDRAAEIGAIGRARGAADLAGARTGRADRAARAGLEDITASALGADLAAMRHETMPVRIYRT